MKHNLFVAYDLITPGQDYEAIHQKIESLGIIWKFQFSFYWLHTEKSANEAYYEIRQVMDPNDKLAVIDAVGGIVDIIGDPPIDAINVVWFD